VEQGGTLVSEGCPGYFGARGKVGTVQPNLGLDALFGAREAYVEFTPDISDDLTLAVKGLNQPVPGALFIQVYEPTGGSVVGTFAEGYGEVGGQPAVVEHRAGAGRTLLVGTFPGVARSRAVVPALPAARPSGSTFTTHRTTAVTPAPAGERLAGANAFFAHLLLWAGVQPHVSTDDSGVIVRLHQGPAGGAVSVWTLNPALEARTVHLVLTDRLGPFREANLHWGDTATLTGERTLTVRVRPRDATVVRLT
jgi:beta-galactosidase